MSELTVGPELDAEVAKACGYETELQFGNCVILVPDVMGRLAFPNPIQRTTRKDFRPSTDLNAAFEAAEKVGLFDSWMLEKVCFDEKVLWTFGRVWYRYEEDGNDMDDDEEFGFNYRSFDGIGPGEPTPALAICAAILALADASSH